MSQLNSQAQAEDQHHRELLARVAAGSRDAFADLYEVLHTPVMRFVYRYTQSTATLEEIVNDTFLIVWQKAASFRGESRAMTWVLGIASRHARKCIGRESQWYRAVQQQEVQESAPGDISRLATQEALEWAMAQLSTDQRLAIELAYYHGASCKEVAEVLDCPLSTAKTRLHYGRRHLRNILLNQEPALQFDDLMGGHGE